MRGLPAHPNLATHKTAEQAAARRQCSYLAVGLTQFGGPRCFTTITGASMRCQMADSSRHRVGVLAQGAAVGGGGNGLL